MANIKLTVTYDGTHYQGWQKTSTGPSIEEALEGVLSLILQEQCQLQAASRTDAGVHATNQVINFISMNPRALELSQLQIALNSLLPKDIVVKNIEHVADNFHPTLDCCSKEYHYQVTFGSIQHPVDRKYAWHIPKTLNISLMRTAAELLLGNNDFSTFCNMKIKCDYTDHIRHLTSIDIIELIPNQSLRFVIRGNHFLYKMVRNIVGTLIYVGCGKIAIKDIPQILHSKDRRLAGITAPAHGLILYCVEYTGST